MSNATFLHPEPLHSKALSQVSSFHLFWPPSAGKFSSKKPWSSMKVQNVLEHLVHFILMLFPAIEHRKFCTSSISAVAVVSIPNVLKINNLLFQPNVNCCSYCVHTSSHQITTDLLLQACPKVGGATVNRQILASCWPYWRHDDVEKADLFISKHVSMSGVMRSFRNSPSTMRFYTNYYFISKWSKEGFT